MNDVFFEQEEGVNITANSLHPGSITTNLFRHSNLINGNHVNISFHNKNQSMV